MVLLKKDTRGRCQNGYPRLNEKEVSGEGRGEFAGVDTLVLKHTCSIAVLYCKNLIPDITFRQEASQGP